MQETSGRASKQPDLGATLGQTDQDGRPGLVPDYSLDEVAAALGMSAAWVRKQVWAGAAHQRYGHKIRMRADQVEALRRSFESAPTTQAITATRRRRAS